MREKASENIPIIQAGYATGGHQEEPRCGKEGADVLFEAFTAGLLVRCL